MNSSPSGPNTSFGDSPAAITLFDIVRYDPGERAKVGRTLQRFNRGLSEIIRRLRYSGSDMSFQRRIVRLYFNDEIRIAEEELKIGRDTKSFLINVMNTRYNFYKKHGY